MQKMMAKKAEEAEKIRVPLADRRSQTHKRMDRWIRLQQFVYGLPDDYSYAICLKENGSSFESHTLVRVGWMNWYGSGAGVDRQHSLAVALLGTTEALSANPTATLMHTVVNRFSRLFRFGRKARKHSIRSGEEGQMAGELLAG
jgi:hypothetical protein